MLAVQVCRTDKGIKGHCKKVHEWVNPKSKVSNTRTILPPLSATILPPPILPPPIPPILPNHGEKMYLVRGSSVMDLGKNTLRSNLTIVMTVKEMKSRLAVGSKLRIKYP